MLLGKIVWLLGVVCWCAIRYTPYRRARRIQTAVEKDRNRERMLLGLSFLGMFVLPLVFVATNEPLFANYSAVPLQIAFGAVICAGAMWIFL